VAAPVTFLPNKLDTKYIPNTGFENKFSKIYLRRVEKNKLHFHHTSQTTITTIKRFLAGNQL
jgi:hypothetical protein